MPTPDENTNAPAAQEAAPTPFKSLLITVGEGIANGNQAVTNDAANVLINRVQRKRAEAIVAVYDALDNLRREQNKIKPDIVSYNADKSIASSTWSMGQLKKKEDGENKIKKYTTALDKAIGTGVYDDLLKLSKSGGSAPAEDEDDKAAA